jgi:DNA-binding MarR family transcriptional regulator
MDTDEQPPEASAPEASAPETSTIDRQVEAFLAVWFRARQQIMETSFKRAHLHGLSATQFLVLTLLGRAQRDAPWTISALAERLNLDPATLVRTVDSLEQRMLVARRRDTRDRRLVFVELTSQGRCIQQEAVERMTRRLATMFRGMSAEGREALLRGLEELVAAGQHCAGDREEWGDDQFPRPS